MLFGLLFPSPMGTWNRKRTKLGYCIFVIALVYHMFSCVHVDGKSISSDKTIKLAKRRGTMKTIRSEDGDVIDCVDIYKQPAFDHPLLKNHTIQMKPSSYPTGIIKTEKFEPELLQSWHKKGKCPAGTIPIVKALIQKSARTRAFVVSPRKNIDEVNTPNGQEYAQVSAVNGNYFGATARLNIWTPATFGNEFSLAQIWVLSGHQNEVNTMEAGWITYSGRKQTEFFIYWTSDGHQKTGCHNLDCPGFVQTNKQFGVGGAINPVSTYGGQQFELSINIHKDKQSGNWWLTVQNIDIGYWPGSIFTRLSDRADAIKWGAEIINSGAQGRHTFTQMGSGHFPIEGFGKASYFRNIGYIDESGAVRDAENLVPTVTNPACYDLQQITKKNDFGTHFYYGGPGFSDKCK